MYFRFCMLWGPYPKQCTIECSNGWWSVSTRPWTLSCRDSSSLESWILLGLKSLMWVLMCEDWVEGHKRCQEIALGWVFLFLNEQKAKCCESHKANNVHDSPWGFFSMNRYKNHLAGHVSSSWEQNLICFGLYTVSFLLFHQVNCGANASFLSLSAV